MSVWGKLEVGSWEINEISRGCEKCLSTGLTCASPKFMSTRLSYLSLHFTWRPSRYVERHYTVLSNVHRGVQFETRALSLLEQHFSMSLKRVGGCGDGGIDMLGWWWIPKFTKEKRRRIRVIVQCKAEKKKISPKYVRELEGVLLRYHMSICWIQTKGLIASTEAKYQMIDHSCRFPTIPPLSVSWSRSLPSQRLLFFMRSLHQYHYFSYNYLQTRMLHRTQMVWVPQYGILHLQRIKVLWADIWKSGGSDPSKDLTDRASGGRMKNFPALSLKVISNQVQNRIRWWIAMVTTDDSTDGKLASCHQALLYRILPDKHLEA